MLRLAGLPFAVEPREELTEEENRALVLLDDGGGPVPPVFRLILVSGPPFGPGGTDLPGPGEPAMVECAGETLRVSKRSFQTELLPLEGFGRLFRVPGPEPGLILSLKVALASVLPLRSGLALHSAAVARGADGLMFFGPSGAGKSTIAGLSPYPVLSDEIVVVMEGPSGFTVRCSGFWGSLDAVDAPRGSFRLRGVFQLAKGRATRLEPLDPAGGFRSLLRVALVPPSPVVWAAALNILGRMTETLTVHRMTWNPAAPPWEALELHLAGLAPCGATRSE